MTSLDQESLFSLELVAESLSLSKTLCCRFPAIAFRLLDFPTLIIYHIEPDLGEAIKRKLKLDSHAHVPEQLIDLKDKNGVFQVKKGKSCLFKTPPNVLLSHLQNTPLYVMVIDTYPATPKLVGNCTVPLDMTMNDVYNDIKRVGLSVPTSHGEKGTYKIFNLMGAEIGQVTFGFRLLSLGVGLISHIPDKSVMKMQKTGSGIVKKSAAVTQAAQKPMEQEATEIILQDLETVDQNIQVVLSTPRPVQSMNETQTDINLQAVATTQTEEKKKKLQKEKKRMNRVDTLTTLAQITPPCDDIIITNTICPPALFYNSEADPPHIAPGLTLDDYLVHKQQRDAMKIDSDTESIDSDSTIRHEDRFSDSELEIKPKPTVKTVSDFPPAEPPKKPKKPSKPVVSLGAMAEFPLLSALMSEIVSLHGTAEGVRGQTASIMAQKQRKGVQKTPSVAEIRRTGSSSSSSTKKALRPVSPTRTFMLRRAMSAALQAKPLEHVPSSSDNVLSPDPSQDHHPDHIPPPSARRKRPVSAKSATSVQETKEKKQKPRSKSQLSATSSSNLVPGMTKSQRLRLSKTNPQLLERLEKEEKERVERFKAKRMQMGVGFYTSETDVNKQTTDSEQYDRYSRKVPKLQAQGAHKKPVPTPRMSVTDDQIASNREIPPVTPRKSRHGMRQEKEAEYHEDEYEEEDYETAPSEREERSQSSNSAASRVIDVRMPSAQMDETASDLDDVEDTLPRKQSLGKTYSAQTKPRSKPSMQYSDDFEGTSDEKEDNKPFGSRFSHSGLGAQSSEPISVQYEEVNKKAGSTEGIDPAETLGLRRMVDTYSDDEEEEEEEEGRKMEGIDAGEALGLQMMVDNYSDNNNQPAGIDAGKALGLRQVVEKYSDDDDDASSKDSQAFHSAKSDDSVDSVKPKPKLKLSTSMVRTVAPPVSDMSPSMATKPSMATRNPMTESISTVDDSNPESTAYLNRSEITNSQFSSLESSGPAALDFRSARRNARKPLASPRKSLDQRTESVSSYAPSEPDIAPLSPTAEYSDNFESAESEEDFVENVKYMKDAKVAPEARFGYTWSGQ